MHVAINTVHMIKLQSTPSNKRSFIKGFVETLTLIHAYNCT